MTLAGPPIRLDSRITDTIKLVRENGADKPGSGAITSDLRAAGTAVNRQFNAAIDGLEALILAHACREWTWNRQPTSRGLKPPSRPSPTTLSESKSQPWQPGE